MIQQDSLALEVLKRLDNIDYTLKGQALEIEHHINRTDLLQDQISWMQWLIPVCFALYGVFTVLWDNKKQKA